MVSTSLQRIAPHLVIPLIFVGEGIVSTFFGVTNDDEGVLLSSARLLRQGELPYLDFPLSKQPLSLLYLVIWPSLIPARLMNVAIGTAATTMLSKKYGWWATFSLFPYFVQIVTQARGETLTYFFAALLVVGASRYIILLAIANRITAFPMIIFPVIERRWKELFVICGVVVGGFFLSAFWLRGILTDNMEYNVAGKHGIVTITLYFYPLWPLLLKLTESERWKQISRHALVTVSMVILMWTIDFGYIVPGNVGTINEAASYVKEPLFTYQNLINVQAGVPLMTPRLAMGRFSTRIDDPRWMSYSDDQFYIDQSNTVAGYIYELRRWDLSEFVLVAVIGDYGQPKEDMYIYNRKEVS